MTGIPSLSFPAVQNTPVRCCGAVSCCARAAENEKVVSVRAAAVVALMSLAVFMRSSFGRGVRLVRLCCQPRYRVIVVLIVAAAVGFGPRRGSLSSRLPSARFYGVFLDGSYHSIDFATRSG